MSLRINTNVAALNAYNNLSTNQAKLEGAFAKLSSGLRINKAADDAAGLSIAQGLTSQINGLTQAVSNANDGINVAQIADGALGTSQDILQRMRSLVVKAGNIGTMDSNSWGAIQQEIGNLNSQLDNIADQTKFGQTNLLDGSYNKNFQVGANGGDTIRLNLTGANTESTDIGNTGVDLTKLNLVNGITPVAVQGLTIETSGAATASTIDADGTGVTALTGTVVATAFGNTGTVGAVGNTTANNVVISDYDSAAGTWTVTDAATGDALGTLSFNSDSGVYTAKDIDGNALGTIDSALQDTSFDVTALPGAVQASTGGGTFAKALAQAGFSVTGPNTTSITDNGDGTWSLTDGAAGHTGTMTVSDGVFKIDGVGAADEAVYINTNEVPTSTYGALENYTSAESSADLSQIGKAIDAISNARSQIGAVQNQLGYTVDNLQTAITNVTASRSNLMDADLATQVTKMSQAQILMQASTSVLAQANSAPRAILKLLG